MNDRHGIGHWAPWVAGALLAALVGVAAYNAGVSHGLAATAGAAATPFAGGRPYLFFPPFGFVFPLLFLFFWFAAARFLFWGRPYRRHGDDHAFAGVPPRLDAWHRRMHEQMDRDRASQQSGTPPVP